MRLELVREAISHDTVQALEELLLEARDGAYTGFVIGLLRPRRKFTVHCVGEACEAPHWSRTICLSIDDDLRAIIQSDDRNTTF